MLKGLRFGSLVGNWDQIRIDRPQVIPSFAAFDAIFKNWGRYCSDTPTQYELRDFKLATLNPESDYAKAIKHTQKFVEIRYLAEPDFLESWCSFQLLYPNNPRLFGCSQCYHNDEKCEVKFVSAIWVRFEDDPRRPTHQRFKLRLWLSTLHWNGTQYNSADTEDSKIGKARSSALRQMLTDEEQLEFSTRFNGLVERARDNCMPRLLAKAEKKKDDGARIREKIESQKLLAKKK